MVLRSKIGGNEVKEKDMCSKPNFEEAKEYSTTVMSTVIDVLDDQKIKYKPGQNTNELILPNIKQSPNDIFSIIYKNCSVPRMVLSILIDIVDIGDDIYIRQKTK